MPTNDELTCPNCGEELEERWMFCPICGMEITETISTAKRRPRFKTEAGRLARYIEFFSNAKETLEADGDLEDALSDCEAAIELDPNSAEAHNLRGLILEFLERKEEAMQSYREALRLDPNFEDARANLADSEQGEREVQFQMAGLDVSGPTDSGRKKLALITVSLLIVAALIFVTLANGK